MNSLNKEFLREDNDKVFLYTGLPHREIWFLFNFIKNSSSESKSSRGILNSFQKFFLGLIRMRLNLSGRDLGYRFGGISEATASRTCSGCTVSSGLKGIPFVKLDLPMDFLKYCLNCVVIIDCFEIFLDHPLNPLARAQTFSSYKRHNTVKYLIGITP